MPHMVEVSLIKFDFEWLVMWCIISKILNITILKRLTIFESVEALTKYK